MTKKKIEAAVEANGRPGIMVAHSVSTCCVLLVLTLLDFEMLIVLIFLCSSLFRWAIASFDIF